VREAETRLSDLHLREWIPESPRGSLLLVHGFGEHSGRHRANGEFFARKGLASFAFDLPGHGESAGRRYLETLDAVRAHVRGRFAPLPLFLLGHSFGGLVVLDALLDGRTEGVRGAILSSPLLGVHPDTRPGPALAGLARILSVALPALPFPNGIDPAHLSRDREVVAAYRQDPLVLHTASPRWFTETEAAMARVKARAGSLGVEALVLYSGADRIVDPLATRAFVAAAPPALVRGVPFEGLSHEILNEPERAQVLEEAWAWLERRLGDS
jgi:alpha-beta hydrolase superfamily lysophospholipase